VQLRCGWSAERHDAVFVVGSLDETIMLRGMRYHPTDIENTVVRCHPKICEWLALSAAVALCKPQRFSLTVIFRLHRSMH